MTRIRTEDVMLALRRLLTEEVKQAAGNNDLVSREEEARLGPVLRRAAEALRVAGGPGARVRAGELVERALADSVAVLGRFNAGNQGRDGLWLARDEIAAIARVDPALGALTELAAQRVRAGVDPIAAMKEAVQSLDFGSIRVDGWPGATKIDARPGQPDRAQVPAPVLVGFDHYYRAEAADWATVRLVRATLAGLEAFAIYTTTDGDDEYLEFFSIDGAPLASARLWAATDLTWDPFFARARLSEPFFGLDDPAQEEGLSEPEERSAAGQVPQDWDGDVVLAKGELHHAHGRLVRIDLPNEPMLTPSQLEVATAGLELIFARSLTHRRDPSGEPLRLGEQWNGTLRVGEFVRPDGRRYEVAYWLDIDDDTYAFYFQRNAAGGLALRIVQYDN